jgi:hypothetical protein
MSCNPGGTCFAVAPCQLGQRAVGGGFNGFNGNGALSAGVQVLVSQPFTSIVGDGWLVQLRNNNPAMTTPITFQAWVVCIDTVP